MELRSLIVDIANPEFNKRSESKFYNTRVFKKGYKFTYEPWGAFIDSIGPDSDFVSALSTVGLMLYVNSKIIVPSNWKEYKQVYNFREYDDEQVLDYLVQKAFIGPDTMKGVRIGLNNVNPAQR